MANKFMIEEISKISEQKIEKPKSEEDKWSIKEFLRFAIIAALIVLPIRFFIAEPFIVRQTSMKPTFLENDYLIVQKIAHRAKNPERGDVIIFKSETSGKSLIKRVIGLPGEIVEIENQSVKITKKNVDEKNMESSSFVLNEPYVIFNTLNSKKSWTLKDDEYFVMGDNRPASFDSRGFGPIKQKDIIGEPLIRFYRFNVFGLSPGFFNNY